MTRKTEEENHLDKTLAPSTSKKRIGVGDVINGKYKIISLLDKGGMGQIFRAEQQTLGRIVALKVMHAPNDSEAKARFTREASLAAGLKHPNTVRIFDYGSTEDGILFLVMELLEGHPLKREFVAGPMQLGRLIQVGRQVCGALHEAHRNHLIHRDIKPNNIFITEHDGVFAKLLDFGLVKNIHSTSEISQTGIVLGSPLYMSPEQVEGGLIDQRSDIYALGMTLYHAATGTAPYDGGLTKILMAHLVRMPPSFQDLNLHHPPLLEWIIFQAIQKAPEDRFQNILQFKKALEILDESLLTNKTIALRMENGELVSEHGGIIDVSGLNQTRIHQKKEPTSHAEQTATLVQAEVQKTLHRWIAPIFIAGILLLLLLSGITLLMQDQTGKTETITKTIVQTREIVPRTTTLHEVVIQSTPSKAAVYFDLSSENESPSCQTPCPIKLKEGEEKDIRLSLSGYKEQTFKLVWNISNPMVNLKKKSRIKKKKPQSNTISTTPTKTKTKTETKPEIKPAPPKEKEHNLDSPLKDVPF